jgi:hypothetical protein
MRPPARSVSRANAGRAEGMNMDMVSIVGEKRAVGRREGGGWYARGRGQRGEGGGGAGEHTGDAWRARTCTRGAAAGALLIVAGLVDGRVFFWSNPQPENVL